MTEKEAIEILEEVKVMDDSMYQFSQKYMDALEIAIADMRKMQYLDGRPCEVCFCHNENGCGVWSCVFDGDGKENAK